MKDMKIYRLSDKPEFVEKVAAVYLQEWQWHFKKEWNISDMKEMKDDILENYMSITFVALSTTNEFMGTVALLESDTEKPNEYIPWLSCLYVDEKYQLDDALRLHLVNFIKSLVDRCLYLWCYTEDDRKFYEKCGFFIVDDMPYFQSRAYVMLWNKR